MAGPGTFLRDERKEYNFYMRKFFAPGVLLLLAVLPALTGCGRRGGEDVTYPVSRLMLTAEAGEVPEEEGGSIQEGEDKEAGPSEDEITEEGEQDGMKEEEKTFSFVDVHQKRYEAGYDPDVPRSAYDNDLFMKIGSFMTYEGDSRYSCRRGIDVSEFNGDIDWNKVKKAGVEFVFIRAGYRGYGSHAGLVEDKLFRQNLEGALKAGLDTGLYFFSQALTPGEAREEADFMIKLLDGKKVSLPLVCDLEHIEFDKARTDDLTPKQATENVRAFCERIREKGFLPMFYSNMVWEAFGYELGGLKDFPVWYADYEPKPQTPYHFSVWQYTNEGKVDGVPSHVDLNIELIPVS